MPPLAKSVVVSVGKTLNPKLLSIRLAAPCVAAAIYWCMNVCEWVNETPLWSTLRCCNCARKNYIQVQPIMHHCQVRLIKQNWQEILWLLPLRCLSFIVYLQSTHRVSPFPCFVLLYPHFFSSQNCNENLKRLFSPNILTVICIHFSIRLKHNKMWKMFRWIPSGCSVTEKHYI